jgi:streptomycin 6-kinase
MRDWSTVLLAASDPRRAAEARCRLLSHLTSVPTGPIWEWGFVERVSTGLLLLSVGDEEAREVLAVAEALVGR